MLQLEIWIFVNPRMEMYNLCLILNFLLWATSIQMALSWGSLPPRRMWSCLHKLSWNCLLRSSSHQVCDSIHFYRVSTRFCWSTLCLPQWKLGHSDVYSSALVHPQTSAAEATFRAHSPCRYRSQGLRSMWPRFYSQYLGKPAWTPLVS